MSAVPKPEFHKLYKRMLHWHSSAHPGDQQLCWVARCMCIRHQALLKRCFRYCVAVVVPRSCLGVPGLSQGMGDTLNQEPPDRNEALRLRHSTESSVSVVLDGGCTYTLPPNTAAGHQDVQSCANAACVCKACEIQVPVQLTWHLQKHAQAAGTRAITQITALSGMHTPSQTLIIAGQQCSMG